MDSSRSIHYFALPKNVGQISNKTNMKSWYQRIDLLANIYYSSAFGVSKAQKTRRTTRKAFLFAIDFPLCSRNLLINNSSFDVANNARAATKHPAAYLLRNISESVKNREAYFVVVGSNPCLVVKALQSFITTVRNSKCTPKRFHCVSIYCTSKKFFSVLYFQFLILYCCNRIYLVFLLMKANLSYLFLLSDPEALDSFLPFAHCKLS